MELKKLPIDTLIMHESVINRIKKVAGNEKVLRIYISPGNEETPWFTTAVPHAWQYAFIRDAFKKFNEYFDLTLLEVDLPEHADVPIHIVAEDQDHVSGSWGATLQEPEYEGWGKIHLVKSSLERDIEESDGWKNRFLHELAHLAGLEHPWEMTDGDTDQAYENPDEYNTTENTLMSWTIPSWDPSDRLFNKPMTWYQEADQKALIKIWGGRIGSIYFEDFPQLQSIEDIITQNQVTTFQLTKSIKLRNQLVDILISGTDKKDKITGSSETEVLAGGLGKDVLKGGSGTDGFLFQNIRKFGKREADMITDFDSDEGDLILVDKVIFGLSRKIKLKVVTGKKETKKALGTNNDFIYDNKKGFLYFNENGKDKGWGDGGLFVKLQGAPELGATDFTIV